MSNAIVKEVQGQVIVEDAQGNRKFLKEGDQILATDKIITGPNDKLILSHPNGDLTIPADMELALAEYSPENLPEVLDEQTSQIEVDDLDDILAVLDGEGDLLDDMEAAAAGEAGNEGSSEIYRIARVLEEVEIGFSRYPFGTGIEEEREISLGDGNRAPEFTITGLPDFDLAPGAPINAAGYAFLNEADLADGKTSIFTGKLNYSDVNTQDTHIVYLTTPTSPVTTNGETIVWELTNGGKTLVGTADGKDIITVTVDDLGNFEVILEGPVDHPEGDGENLLGLGVGVVVEDNHGATGTSVIHITIQDDVPEAFDDTNTITEGDETSAQTSVDGNVIQGDSQGDGQDRVNADGVTVTGAQAGTVNPDEHVADGNVDGVTQIEGEYGYITINPDGSYEYVLDNTNLDVQGLIDSETLDDTFTYTITDSDGDKSTAELTITINGSNDGVTVDIPKEHEVDVNDKGEPVDQDGNVDNELYAKTDDHIVFESGLADGTNPNHDAIVVDSSFTIRALDGLDENSAIVIFVAGVETTLTKDQVEELGTTSVTISTQYGELVLNGYKLIDDANDPDHGNIIIDYEYTLTSAPKNATSGDADQFMFDNIEITANDRDTDTSTQTLSIKIVDDNPRVDAKQDTPAIEIDETALAQLASGEDSISITVDGFGADSFEFKDGADGRETLEYTLAATGDSGLVDTATGEKVILSINSSGEVEGRTEDNNELVFKLAIDNSADANGDVAGDLTLTQFRAVHHEDETDHDDATNLIDDSVALTAKLTDTDGDSAESTVNIGNKVTFRDDGPAIGTPDSVSLSEANLDNSSDENRDSDALTQVGSLNVSHVSADGNDATFMSGLNEVDSGLTSGREKVFYFLNDDDHTLVARKGSDLEAARNGELVFEANITNPTAADAGYEFTLHQALDHSKGEDDLEITLGVVVTDGDGDTATADIKVTVQDDNPAENVAQEMDEDSDGVTFNTSADSRPGDTEIWQNDSKLENGQDDGNGGITYTTDHGDVTVNADGSITYVPAPNFSGDEVFEIRTPDGDISTATMTVNPVADAPNIKNTHRVDEDGTPSDHKSVAYLKTEEDTAVNLGLLLPEVTDIAGTPGNNDESERLGAIALAITGSSKAKDLGGVVLTVGDIELVKGTGTYNKNTVHVIIVDQEGSTTPSSLHHTNAVSDLSNSAGVNYLTKEQYESIIANPYKDSHENFTIQVKVDSFEVDGAGNKLKNPETGKDIKASSQQSLSVRVKAVTDDVELTVNTGLLSDAFDGITVGFEEDNNGDLVNNKVNIFIDEDDSVNSLNLKDMLSASFEDLDGSEERWFTIENNTGEILVVNGVKVPAGETFEVAAPGLSSSTTDFPDIIVSGDKHFAGNLEGIIVTLHAQDKDADGWASDTKPQDTIEKGSTVDIKSSEITLNLYVNPVADAIDQIRVKPVEGYEDAGRDQKTGDLDATDAGAIPLSIAISSEDTNETHTVKITDIHDGSVLKYNGVEVIPNADGEYIIEKFDSNLSLTLTPPHNSNKDMVLKVTAQTVDTVEVNRETVTHKSEWSDSPVADLHVLIKGVADEADVVMKEFIITEGELDGHDGAKETITLDQLVSSITMHDTDGSETLSFKITGLPEGFNVTGDNVISMGNGEWVVSVDVDTKGKTQEVIKAEIQEELAKVKIHTPEHFSGQLTGSIAAITTENDGDSRTGEAVDFNAYVNPTAEAVLSNKTSEIDEDTPTQLNFGDLNNKGDTNEALDAIFIKVSDTDPATAGDVLLTYGEGNIGFAGIEVETIDGVDYYKLTGEDINNIYAQNTVADFAHNSGGKFDLEIKYQVTDHLEGTAVAGQKETDTVIKDATHSITITPITDDVTLTYLPGAIEQNLGPAGLVGRYSEIKVNYTVNKDNDHDGSEYLTQIELSGIPQGLLVSGISFGDGALIGKVSNLGLNDDGTVNWVVFVPKDQEKEYGQFLDNNGDLSGQIHLKPTSSASKEVHSGSSITFVTKDTGAEDTKSITGNLDIDLSKLPPLGGGNLYTIDVSVENKEYQLGKEDTPIQLSDMVSASFKIKNGLGLSALNDKADYSIIIEKPQDHNGEEAVLYQMINGERVDIATDMVGGKEVWIISGKGKSSDLEALLDSLYLLPPKDFNDNFSDDGGMSLDIRVTGHIENGQQAQGDVNTFVPVEPVTDKAEADITFAAADDNGNATSDKPVEGKDVAITIQLSDTVDRNSDFGDLYLKVDTAIAGTIVGAVEATSAEVSAMGLPSGTYYKVEQPHSNNEVNLVFRPSGDHKYTSGDIKVSAWFESTEQGADNTVMNEISGVTGTISPINNDFNEVDISAEGLEGQPIEVVIKPKIEGEKLLVDNDGSESIKALRLDNIPNDFLVYVDGKLATNSGSKDGGQTNSWLVVGADEHLSNITIVPPAFWSGEVTDLEFSALAGEAGKEVWTGLEDFSITVNPVADGFQVFDPKQSFNDADGVFNLNLNMTMTDRVDASVEGADDAHQETTTLEFENLGENAQIVLGDKILGETGDQTVTYADGKYTVTGLSQGDLANLSVIQAPSQIGSSITVNGWTVDGNSTSIPENAEFEKSSDFNIVERPFTPETQEYNGGDVQVVVGNDQNNELTTTDAANESIIYTGSGNNTINAGAAENTIYVDGEFNFDALDNINTINGSGANEINLVGSGDKGVQLADISGENTINTGAETNYITTGTALETYYKLGGEQQVTVTKDGDGYKADFTEAADVTAIIGDDNNTVKFGSGENELDISGSSNQVNLGTGDSEVTISGNSNTIEAGDGADNITVSGSNNIIDGVTSADTVEITAGSNNIVNVTGPDAATIIAGDIEYQVGEGSVSVTGSTLTANGGAATVTLPNGQTVTLATTGGSVTAEAGSYTVAAPAEGMTVEVNGTEVELAANNSVTVDNTGEITLAGDNNTVTATDAADKIIITGDSNVIESGEGDDLITVSGAGNTVNAGDGEDTITITGTGDNTVDAGAGDDTVVIDGTGTNTITGGLGDDVFEWTLASAGANSSTVITDFGMTSSGDSDNDALDISALLTGFDSSDETDSLENYLNFEQVGYDVVVTVSKSGDLAGGSVDQTITLEGVNLDTSNQEDLIDSLMNSGNLIV